jgi:tetratricopeptide (TPR) repeat protein
MRWLSVAAVGILLAAATGARAETLDADPDTEIARRHFQAGSDFYEKGRYEEALTEFKAARAVRKAPQLDYNIARCLDRMERFREAVDYYRQFQAANGPDSEVDARIKVLEERLGTTSPPPETPQPVIAPPPSAPIELSPPLPTSPSLVPPLVVGVAALAAVAAGTALVVTVKPDYDAVQASCPHDCPEDRWSDLRTRAYAGYALWAVGGALAVTDVVMWIVRARRGADRLRALVVPGPGGIAAVGQF